MRSEYVGKFYAVAPIMSEGTRIAWACVVYEDGSVTPIFTSKSKKTVSKTAHNLNEELQP